MKDLLQRYPFILTYTSEAPINKWLQQLTRLFYEIYLVTRHA